MPRFTLLSLNFVSVHFNLYIMIKGFLNGLNKYNANSNLFGSLSRDAPGGHPVLEQLMWLDIEGTLSVFGQIYRIVQRIPRGLDKFVKHATIIIKEA